MERKRILRNLHISYVVLKLPFLFISRVLRGFRSTGTYKIAKGESAMIISNHQTDIDFMHIMPSFNRHMSAVSTDTAFSGPKVGKFLFNNFGMIPKKKGTNDLNTVKMMADTFKNKGSVLLFFEGNRSYAEFQFYMSESIVRFIKKFKPTLILYRLEGGTGTSPRFMNKRRKGKFTGGVKRVLKAEEYLEYSDEELFKIIQDTIRSYDSESGNLYKSKRRAEYLEKMFFVCPCCLKMNTLESSKNTIVCHNCGLEIEYTEQLTLKVLNKDLHLEHMLDWWNLQKRYVKDLEIPDDIIFEDDDIELYRADPFKKKEKLYEGSMKLSKDQLLFGDLTQEVKDIEIASVVSGARLSYNLKGEDYLIKSKNKRFNPLKYVLMFNKLDTVMRNKGLDKYYNLEEN